METMEPEIISIKFSSSCFIEGKNTIMIKVDATDLEYGALNTDDIEFWDVKLEIK